MDCHVTSFLAMTRGLQFDIPTVSFVPSGKKPCLCVTEEQSTTQKLVIARSNATW
jgi:hypothetical protein